MCPELGTHDCREAPVSRAAVRQIGVFFPAGLHPLVTLYFRLANQNLAPFVGFISHCFFSSTLEFRRIRGEPETQESY